MNSSRALLAIAACLLSATAAAQEFRRIQPIGGVRPATRQPAATPEAVAEAMTTNKPAENTDRALIELNDNIDKATDAAISAYVK